MAWFRFLMLFVLLLPFRSAWSQQSMQYLDTLYQRALRAEQLTTGLYLNRLEFNSGLQSEVTQPDKAPYPQLRSLFSLAGNWTTMIANDRKIISSKNRTLDSLYSLYHDDQVIYLLMEEDADFRMATTSGKSVMVVNALHDYDSLCTAYGIARHSMTTYAEAVYKAQVQFQDSLMLQGSIVATLKRELNTRISDTRSEEYRKYYSVISEMEKMLKDYQQVILQLENSQARFESANPEDYFYTGPYIMLRFDIEATENIVSQLKLGMADFRQKEAHYRTL